MGITNRFTSEEYVEERLANLKASLSPIQSDWNQEDKNELDFIKNKPFGPTDEKYWLPLAENASPMRVLMSGFVLYDIKAEFIAGRKYKLIIDGEEYIRDAVADVKDSACIGNIGGSINNFPSILEMDFSKLDWTNGDWFCLNSGILTTNTAISSGNCVISLYQEESVIKTLDRQYISYIPGENVEYKKYTIEDIDYIAGNGAEIFNDYKNNIAIGNYSHAEGYENIASGAYSHVEGCQCKADGLNAHAEGNSCEALGASSHAEGSRAIAEGTSAHAEGVDVSAPGWAAHVEGMHTIASGELSHVQGRYNIPEQTPKYQQVTSISTNYQELDGDIPVYLCQFKGWDDQTGLYTIEILSEKTLKDLQVNDSFVFSQPTGNTVTIYYKIDSLISSRIDEETGKSYYNWKYYGITRSESSMGSGTKLAHIVGNGIDKEKRSNAHTLDWNGNAWYQGDVYVGSNSGVNKDEGSKKLATEDFVKTAFVNLNSNTVLSFYCVEDVTIVTNGISKVYPANSNVEVRFTENDVFEIVPTSNNSIFALNAFPGALNTFYPWLEGVKQFSNILFDMNSENMYTKWNQGNQGVYQVQYAQYINCIFWSDNPYISDVAKRTNYTLYYTSQLPLCYSNIPDNTFKAFYLAFSVNSDPNWGNKAYRDSFAKATWATQVFSYYGARTIGIFGHDNTNFNIVLPKDCRGLMYAATAIENAGTFDAINTTNFGAKQGSWRDAFGQCSSLRNLYIKNLKVSLDLSWSPIEYKSISYIISEAANTSAITISVSPYTYYLLSQADFELATEKNITIELLSTHYSEDKRLNDIADKADKEYVDEAISSTKNDLLNGAGEAYDTLKELADLIDENHDAIDALETIAAGKADVTHTHVISEVDNLQNQLDTLTEHTANDDIHFTAAERAQLTEIADIITQAAYIDILDNEIITDADTSGSKNIDVDSTLSETSENPVQNKVITNEINELNDKIDKMLELSGGDTITIPNYLSGTKVIMSSYIKISDTPIPREALVNGGSYTITYLNTSKTQLMTFADRSVQNYLECATMFQFGAFITVVEDTDLYGEAVEAGLYADAFPYTPNTYASSLTLNQYDGFISEKIKESYLPSFDNKVDVKQGKANANHFVMTDENGDITASKLISDTFGFLTCSVIIDIDSSNNAILYIDPAGDEENVSYNLKIRNFFSDPSSSPKDLEYYIFDFDEGYTFSTEAIDAIRSIESYLNRGTFTNIKINIYGSDVVSNYTTRSGGNGSYIVDAYEGISFGFGKTYVRITTNTAGQGSSEPE